MSCFSNIGGFNGVIIMIIGFIVNNLLLKSTVSKYISIKKAFPWERKIESGFHLSNAKRLGNKEIERIKQQYTRKEFNNNFFATLTMVLHETFHCKIKKKQQ